jgi:hypothetical protein
MAGLLSYFNCSSINLVFGGRELMPLLITHILIKAPGIAWLQAAMGIGAIVGD